jgi:hypothetical protein
MKLRNMFLAIAVAAVAGVNVYLANDIRVQRNELSLLNLEHIAEAVEGGEGSNNHNHSEVKDIWSRSVHPNGIEKCYKYGDGCVKSLGCDGRNWTECQVKDDGDPQYAKGYGQTYERWSDH